MLCTCTTTTTLLALYCQWHHSSAFLLDIQPLDNTFSKAEIYIPITILGLFFWTIHLVEIFLPIYMTSSKFVLSLYPPLCLYVQLLIATICKFLWEKCAKAVCQRQTKRIRDQKIMPSQRNVSLEHRAAFPELACGPLSTDTHIFLAHRRSKNCPKPSRISEDRGFGHHVRTPCERSTGVYAGRTYYTQTVWVEGMRG